jgi:DNA-directed RNA polymerase specialized sigma24 family protein
MSPRASGLRQLLASGPLARDGATDAQLLDRFLTARDEAAFRTVVDRHAPMGYGMCQRVLGNHHDAEDAFQATILVLARRARAACGERLGP